jgi:hypothetical protein
MSGTIYSGPVFDMACRQFKDVADYLAIPEEERGRLLYPKRAVAVSCPIHRDDGTTEVFQGYRVQHHLTLGPTKGGTRFAVNVDIGEVAALAIWMSWKCALAGLPYGGAKGGIAVDPYSLSARELEALSRRYMQEMIPFVGPHTDVMAPDMGTNDQVRPMRVLERRFAQRRRVPPLEISLPLNQNSGGFDEKVHVRWRVGPLSKCAASPRKDMDRSILDRRTPSDYCSNVQRYVIDVVLIFRR